ncbi:MAG: hypothetical protein VZQ84_04360, partial [Anaerovoracaceae bacterium]|nr:hypothetical protein [Anaerovoracaceae bacterium]
GSAIVEAAVALPLIILAVITMIYILLNMFAIVRSDVRMHAAANERAGQVSRTWNTYRHHPKGINVSDGRYIYRKCVYAKETLRFGRAGLLNRSITRNMESRGYVTDEKKFIRYADFFDKGTQRKFVRVSDDDHGGDADTRARDRSGD